MISAGRKPPKASSVAPNFFEALPPTAPEKKALRLRAQLSAALKIREAILRAKEVAASY